MEKFPCLYPHSPPPQASLLPSENGRISAEKCKDEDFIRARLVFRKQLERESVTLAFATNKLPFCLRNGKCARWGASMFYETASEARVSFITEMRRWKTKQFGRMKPNTRLRFRELATLASFVGCGLDKWSWWILVVVRHVCLRMLVVMFVSDGWFSGWVARTSEKLLVVVVMVTNYNQWWVKVFFFI